MFREPYFDKNRWKISKLSKKSIDSISSLGHGSRPKKVFKRRTLFNDLELDLKEMLILFTLLRNQIKIKFKRKNYVECEKTLCNKMKIDKQVVPSIGVSLHRWGDFTQSLKFKFLYKSHCKSYELLWVSYFMMFLKSPQQFAGFAVTLVKKFKF